MELSMEKGADLVAAQARGLLFGEVAERDIFLLVDLAGSIIMPCGAWTLS